MSGSIAVSGGMALVKLKCAGATACAGKLTLTTSKTLKNKHSHTILIGTVSFSITADGTTTAKIKLNAAGRGLLGAAHGRLAAHLMIAATTPTPVATLTRSVHLLQQRAHGGRKR